LRKNYSYYYNSRAMAVTSLSYLEREPPASAVGSLASRAATAANLLLRGTKE